MRLCFHFALIFAIGASAFPVVSGAQDGDARIRSLAEPLVRQDQVVGISIGVIADGKPQTVHLGKTAVGKPAPDDQTVYEIGSISKVFTGLLLARDVVDGELSLQQTAAGLLPESVPMPSSPDREITLLDLATHRSGLPRLPDNLTELSSDNPYSKYDTRRAYAFLKTYQLPRKPGEKYEYSNFAASLLGDLVTRRHDSDYDQRLAAVITGPLKMASTAVQMTGDMKAHFARPHTADLTPTRSWEFADMPGAGGIRSNVVDMLAFAQANLNPPDGPLGKAINLAWKQHHPGNEKDFAMGLGWHIARDGQTRWHNGGTGGFRSMMMVNRQLGVAVVVLANTASPAVDALAEQIMQVLAGADIQTPEPQQDIDVPEKTMRRYVGEYQLAPNFVFDVDVVEGRLMVGVTGQPTFQVFAKSETEWFYKVVPATLTFKLGDDGKAESLVLFQNGVRQTAKRITRK